jgi:hypothetical protein
MTRRLDPTWLTTFGFFVATVALCAGGILYRAHIEEVRYAELYRLLVQAQTPKPSVHREPGPMQRRDI